MEIMDLQKRSHAMAREKGFYDTPPSFAERIALMHWELSEAIEEYRERGVENLEFFDQGKPLGLAVELADAVIRIADAAEWLGFDLGAVIERKMAYNATRPHKHGKKF